MKTPIYLLLILLVLSASSFDAKAQPASANNSGAELFAAVKSKNSARALELIKQGANLDYDAEGDTTVSLAIRNRDTEMAKALLAAGANPNFKESKYGGTALRRAVQMSNVELVELLIDKYKADVNPKNDSGYSILHVAADFNSGKEITALLLAAGSDPNVINENGRSPYEYALSMQKTDIAALLAMVTNAEKIALLKKEKGASTKPAKSAPANTAVSADEEDPDEEMERIAVNIVRRYKQKGFQLFDEGFTETVGRNSNAPSVKSKAVFKRTFQQFVMISKDAVALNAVMNSTLLQVPCDNCRTSISTYATTTESYSIDGYRVVALSVALLDYQNTFIDLIFKGNSPGSRAKWLFISKDL